MTSLAMDDLEGAVVAVDMRQPRRTMMANSVPVKKPSAVPTAAALLSALLSPSASPNSLSDKASHHEWTIATVVMAIVLPGVDTHTPTATGTKMVGVHVQACDLGEAMDGSRASVTVPVCIWSICACLQPSLVTTTARVPA